MKEQLNDTEIVKIEAFVKDRVLFDAVRKVLLAGLYTHGTVQKDFIPNPLINGAFSLVHLATENPIPDEIIGQQLRAQWAGINALKNAYDKLSEIRGGVESPFVEKNEAI